MNNNNVIYVSDKPKSFPHALHMLSHFVFNCLTVRSVSNSRTNSPQMLFIMFALKIGLKYSLFSKTKSISFFCCPIYCPWSSWHFSTASFLLSYVVRIFSLIVFSSKKFLNTNSA